MTSRIYHRYKAASCIVPRLSYVQRQTNHIYITKTFNIGLGGVLSSWTQFCDPGFGCRSTKLSTRLAKVKPIAEFDSASLTVWVLIDPDFIESIWVYVTIFDRWWRMLTIQTFWKNGRRRQRGPSLRAVMICPKDVDCVEIHSGDRLWWSWLHW